MNANMAPLFPDGGGGLKQECPLNVQMNPVNCVCTKLTSHHINSINQEIKF